ncbi:hypothetical protein G9A89_011251 [Geosiphon pyriformis]|nr:hypothetical protein G9A89_011251 [Geosiphon pyriformis]
MLALKTISELSITVTGNHINYTKTEVVTNSAPNSRKYYLYKKNTRNYFGIYLPELLKLALRENLMLILISIPPNATIQQRFQLCLNKESTEYSPIYRYFHIGKTLYEQKLELTTANLTKKAIQKQLYNEFKTTAGPTNSCYKLRAALRLYDLFHTCENILQNPILQPLKIQYIGKLTELKFQQFSDQISSIIWIIIWKLQTVLGLQSSSHYNKHTRAKKRPKTSVWHPDGSIHSGFSSSVSAVLKSYFIKALYYCLPTAKKKKIYKSSYSSILCIHCGLTDDFNHAFLCKKDSDAKKKLISNMVSNWADVLGAGYAGCSGFVIEDWVNKTMSVLSSGFNGDLLIINMVHDFVKGHRSAIWVLNTRLKAYYEKHGLLPRDGSSTPAISGLASQWSHRKICNFGVKLGIHMCFGLYSGLVNMHFGFLHNFSVVGNLGV